MSKGIFFEHSANASSEPKMQALRVAHGAAGVGIYWCLVEYLHAFGSVPVEDCKGVSYAFQVSPDLVRSVLCDFGLFDTDGLTFFLAKEYRESVERKAELSRKRAQAVNARWAKRDERERYKCNTNVSAAAESWRGTNIPPTLEEVREYAKMKIQTRGAYVRQG